MSWQVTKCRLPLPIASYTNHVEEDDDDKEYKEEVDDDNYNDKEEGDDGVVQAGPWLRIMHTVLQVSGMPARI